MINAILCTCGPFKKEDKTEQDRHALCPPSVNIQVGEDG